jgi:hypothetical protein
MFKAVPSNVFTVQLSDAAGSFASPVNIGSGTSSPIMATLPSGTVGTAFRIRVVAFAPRTTGTDNSADISISAIPSAPSVTPASVCGVGSAILTASGATTGQTYRWYTSVVGGTAVADNSGASFTTTELTRSTTFYVSIVNSAGCESSRTAVEVAVTTPLTNNTISQDQVICSGQRAAEFAGSVPASGTGTYTYLWQSSTDGVNFIAVPGSSFASYAPSLPLTNTTWFRRIVMAEASCAQSASNAVKVTVNATPDRPNIKQSNAALEADVVGAYYEWLKDGKPVGDSTQTIPITGAGGYMVRVMDKNGCYSEYSELFEPTLHPTGINGLAESLGLFVLPNPSNGKLTVVAKQTLLRVEMTVVSAAGYTVYKQSLPVLTAQHDLNLEHLPAGFYLLLLTSGSGHITQKLIITD